MDSFFSHGMDKLQDPRMETKTICGGEFITMSVLAIAQDRVAYRRQMYTYLVGAPSLEIEFQEGEGQLGGIFAVGRNGFYYFVVGNGYLSAIVHRRRIHHRIAFIFSEPCGNLVLSLVKESLRHRHVGTFVTSCLQYVRIYCCNSGDLANTKSPLVSRSSR